MLRVCEYCGKLHRFDEYCPQKPKRLSKYNKHSAAAKFRATAAWTEKSIHIRQRDYNLCRVCLDRGIIRSDNLAAHHIEPLSECPDRRLDDDNLVSLCGACHKLADAGLIDRGYLHRLAVSPPDFLGKKFKFCTMKHWPSEHTNA